MPTGPDLDFFKSFSSTDLAALGDAIKSDPTLMMKPELTTRDKLARGFNDATRVLGIIFGNQDALRLSTFREQQFKQDEQSQMLGRLLPALGAAQAKRADAAAAEKAEQKLANRQIRMQKLMEDMANNWEKPTGEPWTAAELNQFGNASVDWHDNPGATMPTFPWGEARRITPEMRAGREQAAKNAEEKKEKLDPQLRAAEVSDAARKAGAAESARQGARNTPAAIEGERKRVDTLTRARSGALMDDFQKKLEAKGDNPAARDLASFVKRGTQTPAFGPALKPTVPKQIEYLRAEATKLAKDGGPNGKNKVRIDDTLDLIDELSRLGKAQAAEFDFGGGGE